MKCNIVALFSRFEIFVVVEGDSILTGQRSKSQSSYLSSEILWGHKFVPCIEEDETQDCYRINYAVFNKTSYIKIPMYSAKQMRDMQNETISSNYLSDLD